LAIRERLRTLFSNRAREPVTKLDMITQREQQYFSWNGQIYKSDIVYSCIQPVAHAAAMLTMKHVVERTDPDGKRVTQINPSPQLKFLLSEPNELLNGRDFIASMLTTLKINKNAFALIRRDPYGVATALYPIDCSSAEQLDVHGEAWIRFTMAKDAKVYSFPCGDLVILREGLRAGRFFADSISDALRPMMDVVTTTDQGIVSAIKNSNVVKFLLRCASNLRDEELEKKAASFAKAYMGPDAKGVAAIGGNIDAIPIDPKDYVPNAAVIDRNSARILGLFGTNDKIIHSQFDDAEWNSYFEAQISPAILLLADELTRKIFTRTQRSYGNSIVIEASLMDTVDIKTKLDYVAMVDRGAMTPNEWRSTMHLAPIPGGDEPIRRLDTQPTQTGGEEGNK
jgi:HK97 family phage portal protein